MKLFATTIIIILVSSCSTFKMAIPSKFSEVSTRMPVKGLQGFMIRQKISFGNFQTSIIKRGWTISTSKVQNQFFSDFLKAGMQNTVEDSRNKLSFTLNNGNRSAEVFCQTNISTEQTTFIRNSKWMSSLSSIDNFDYTFSATILPVDAKENESWQLLYYKTYDADKDTSMKVFSILVATEEGIATNGKEKIIITPIRVNKSTNKKGKTTTLFYKVPSGYELKIDDGLVCIINTIDREIWMYNDLDESTRFAIGCIASALMLSITDN